MKKFLASGGCGGSLVAPGIDPGPNTTVYINWPLYIMIIFFTILLMPLASTFGVSKGH